MGPGLYAILDIPWVYRLSQTLLAPGKPWMIQKVFDLAFPHSRGKVLDLGCGPKLVTPEPKGLLVGVDINEAFLRDYTGGSLDRDPRLVARPPKGRTRLGYRASVDHLPFAAHTFDEIRAVGFLHHLPDRVLEQAVKEMRRCLKPGGRVVVLEDVWPRNGWTRPMAWFIRRFDRGAHMRDQEGLLRIFTKAWPGKWETSRHTYTLTGSELLYLTRRKREGGK
ncbi:MAG TPA: class I SAM-dependent methyltransferase [bacterium]|nr:class I SAM-dependent methyltransferase [bacterium]